MTQAQEALMQPDQTMTIIGELVARVAADPASEQSIAPLLERVRVALGADWAVYVQFEEPAVTVIDGSGFVPVPPVAALQAWAEALSSALQVNLPLPGDLGISVQSSAVAAIVEQVERLGLFGVGFTQHREFAPAEIMLLKHTLDLLTILAINLREKEHHEATTQLNISLLNSISDPLIILDHERRLLRLNRAAEAVFHTTTEQTQGKTLLDVVQSPELAAMGDGNAKPPAEWVSPDDKTFVPHIEAVRDDSGELKAWVLALRDITHYKRLNRNQSEFMRIVSHDLRSPLTAMQGFASMLELGLVGELNEKQQHFVSKILSGINQMTALVENIQDAGRYDPQSGFYELSRSHCDLGDMLRRIVDNQLIPAEKQLNISVSVADNVPIINADATMLERAIINLVDNAIKYTPTGGKIEVAAKSENNEVILFVRDNGLGINADDLSHLFERHVRVARQEYKKIKGSGLGLFIVRSVAQRHGGDAWVESTLGVGSTFFVRIPLDGANLVTAPAAE
jgi:signal transduction histidine kinase